VDKIWSYLFWLKKAELWWILSLMWNRCLSIIFLFLSFIGASVSKSECLNKHQVFMPSFNFNLPFFPFTAKISALKMRSIATIFMLHDKENRSCSFFFLVIQYWGEKSYTQYRQLISKFFTQCEDWMLEESNSQLFGRKFANQTEAYFFRKAL